MLIFIRRKHMQNILDAVNALAGRIDILSTTIANQPKPGTSTVDLTPVTDTITQLGAKIDTLAAAVADIRALEAPATPEVGTPPTV